jgi:threonine/homoserine/homoserine lactone efflux protein
MPTTATLLAFALVCVGLVLTPGPNMIYLVSRSLTQGVRAGLVSLAGTLSGFFIHIGATVTGLAAIAFAAPFLYDAIRYAGAAYLAWLAWETLKPGGRSVFEPVALPAASDGKLFAMGFITSVLNPKVALFYISLLPQFVDPERGTMLGQMLALSAVQLLISLIGNTGYVLTAACVARFFSRNPLWVAVQRWTMGSVLAGLAMRLALDKR